MTYGTYTHCYGTRHCSVYGLGLSGQAGLGTKVFFSGCSAGARGALVNLDYVPAMLPRAVEVRLGLESCV
jgi:hypothetical protein